MDNIQAISEVLDFCKEHFPAEQEWASTWLAALLHEFYSVSEFGKVEKQQYKDLLEYAIRQVGGLDRICYKIKYPLDRIIYIARQYHAWMTTPEKKKLQKEYRDVF